MEYKTIGQQLKESESLARLLRDKRGSAIIELKGNGLLDFEEKATMTSDGAGRMTAGVLPIDQSTITPPARRRLFMRDLLTVVPTGQQVIGIVRVSSDAAIGSPQSETSAKGENALSLSADTTNVRTVATWLPASKQILDDIGELSGFIGSTLRYAVRKEEDRQILNGDGTGENLDGFIGQATAFDTSLLVPGDGWEYADQIARAKQQLESADEIEAAFVALNPTTYWGIRLTKDSNGQYIYGSPSLGDRQFNIFGLTPIRSNAIATTQFLVGSTAPTAAVLREREELIVEISMHHSDFFARNLVAIRAEERVALVVYRPASYIEGTFSQSPA